MVVQTFLKNFVGRGGWCNFFSLPVGILEVSDSKRRTTAGVVDDVFDDSLKKK
jgi:hypothetical protein